MMELFGKFDENIRLLEEEFRIKIIVRQTQLRIIGGEKSVDMAFTVLNRLLDGIGDGTRVDKGRVRYLIQLVKAGETDHIVELTGDVICVTYKGKQIKCKTLGQTQYVKAMRRNDIVFGIGPAGTGKTYLSMAMAVNAFKNKEINRIILTRPAVEAGEKLGFLPGDLQNKVDPYLRPLYDALHDLMGLDTYTRLIERGIIEVAPLAYMRGRTLDDAFIILDEAQNTTSEQMKMFLTRLGIGSKAVINGDITQIDLPTGAKSGLVEAAEILNGVKGIGFVYLTHRDVVRHELVMSIIRAYDNFHRKGQAPLETTGNTE
ncbi:MAG TPA: PhoH family protein [Clostridia bacterium]|nr:PhoH family protein [Clostridia bacterium]